MKKKLSIGLKIWLGFMILVCIASIVGLFDNFLESPIGVMFGTAMQIIQIYAYGVLLFQKKKIGFQILLYMYGGCAVLVGIILLFIGIHGGFMGIVLALTYTVILAAVPAIRLGITWLLMQKNMDMFD